MTGHHTTLSGTDWGIDEMLEKINACYERLQKLNIQATRENMEILTQTLYDLQDVFKELEGEKSAADTE